MRAAAETLAARARTQYVDGIRRGATLRGRRREAGGDRHGWERAYQQHGALLEVHQMFSEFEALRPDPRFRDCSAA